MLELYSTITEASVSHKCFYVKRSKAVLALTCVLLLLVLLTLVLLPLAAIAVIALSVVVLVSVMIEYYRLYYLAGQPLRCIGVNHSGWFINNERCVIEILSTRLLSASLLTIHYRHLNTTKHLLLPADTMTSTDYHQLKLALQFNAADKPQSASLT